jgi:pilus assembly protein CpaC
MSFTTQIVSTCNRAAASLMVLSCLAAPQGHAQTQPVNGRHAPLSVHVGQSTVIDAPWPAKRVSVNDPTVADVDMTSPRRIQVIGKAPGMTEVTMWSEAGDVWQGRVEVEADLSRLQAQLRKLFPDSTLEATQVGKVVVVKGSLTRVEQVPQLRRFFELSKQEYVDATRVAGVQQVQLRVKIAEVSRQAMRALNINTFYGGDDHFFGVQLGSSAGPFTPMSIGPAEGAATGNIPFVVPDGGITVPPTATVFAGFPNSDLEFFIQALAENQYLRVLAEPTLVAFSGQQASFLAGGEFPVPIANLGGGGTTEISIEYKDFGVQLDFRPIVLGNGKIHLKVVPEVSQLSDVGAIRVLGTSVPSVLSRRVETELELQDGQTFAIAGLINRTDNATVSRVPWLGDLPVLGAMFRSVRYNQSETELLVLVTASLVEPTSTDADLPAPGMTHSVPNDWELFVEGRLSGRTPTLAPAHAAHLRAMGLNELHGPGGWATYDSATNGLAGEGSSAKRGQ